MQKGFVGTCAYRIDAPSHPIVAYLTTLAEFANYTGVGCKTTMEMGQVRILQ
ncbi:CRISPR system precrRNA processing endoribonuclease RAMP protein Cas6 [Candidatus Chlorohelix allophototropha]|uniref:CRISPR system precrRNA processing endoribonuclease RAMP protein Cas6 n=1 Tax=Candidatus Chlorohelix allophototropha TaxID=3003348 RepID=UPI003CE4F011